MPQTVKRQPPLSIRLSAEERALITERAGILPIGTYVKQVLFDAPVQVPRGGGITLANRTLLAHLLATLGGSHLAPNLERLAHEAALGNLFCDEETTERLLEACDDVRLMHNALMRGLGMKEKSPSQRELDATDAFNRSARQEDRE